MFADRARIFIRSGKGGDGHVSFRREKYVPAGGPDGGDGGNGGDLILVVDPRLNTLVDFRHKRKYIAGDGKEGSKRHCTGASGEDMIVKVPPGTIVKDVESGKVILDMANRTEPVVLLKGGRGGKGNTHYVTSTMQAPKYAQPGQDARELWVDLELKVIADVGLVGFPNVGKSTLLSRVTNANPKIANYHFTTLNPTLGVVDLDDGNGFVIADIPGIIEGASEGVGLGLEFLRHIERTKVMIHLVDAASVEGRDPIEDIYAINKELESYNEELAKRPQVIAANKIDAMPKEDRDVIVEMLEEEFGPQGIRIFPISAVSGEGVKELLWHVNQLLKELPEETVEFEQEFFLDFQKEDTPDSIVVDKAEPGVFTVEGPKVERMLGYTNLESEKGFEFFQKFMKENDVLKRLEELGIEEGDTVKVYNLEFDYYK
ncbi:MAG: GTPase ObgE [Clostridiales bacterium]|nr:GTPase ObgE [Clostridiales bacterium]